MSSATILRFPFGGLVHEFAPAGQRPPEVARLAWFTAFAPSPVRAEPTGCPHHENCPKLGCLGRCEQPPPDAA